MDAMMLEHLPHYTYEDYKQWEGDWELIYGIPFAMAPAPVKRHQQLMGRIFAILDEALEACEDCEVVPEEDWKVREDLVLRPDVVVVCRDENEKYITKAPEIVFEIVSPSTAKKDENLKFAIYAQEGVKYYILVYPEDLTAKVFKNVEGRFKKVGDFMEGVAGFDKAECPVAIDFGRLFSRFR